MAVIAFLIGAGFVSCTKNDVNGHQKSERITISLGFKGEILTSESPLAKSSTSNDIYVVQVYYYPTGSDNPVRYAYGFFSDTSNISIDLYSNYKYEFRAWCFKEGMEYDSFGNILTIKNTGGESGRQLKTSDVENKFIYSTETRYEPVTQEGLKKNDINDYSKDYYCCYVDDFTPTASTSLTFDMFRCVFGYSINAENIETGYQLKLTLGNRDTIVLTSDNSSYEAISHFYNWSIPSYEIWEALRENQEFTQETTIKVTLIDPNSMEDIIAEESISFTRNKMKNITIKLKETTPQGPTSTNIGFNLETTEMVFDESATTITQE